MRNKSDLDTMSMDDLYNNLKVYEAEIKSQSSSSSNSQNVAFVSSENTSSTNEAVNTAHEGNPQYALQDQGIFDSRRSRHITGNKSYLTDYQDIDGGFVAFDGSPK
ncbi:hypothetical protein Tco_1186288 [Tanacetum coccineum]